MQLLLLVVMLLDLCHKPLPLIFCQANDLISPGVHFWKREKDAAARGDVTGPVSQARPTDLVLLCARSEVGVGIGDVDH